MANKKIKVADKHQKKLWMILVLIVVFGAGFLVARARYKPQIQATYNLVVEKQAEVDDLQAQIDAYKTKMTQEMELLGN